MANFLLLFRGGDSTKLSPAEMQAHMQRWGAWLAGLRAAGQLHSCEPLVPGGRVVAGRDKLITDGPFAEAKDLVSGYLLLAAEHLDTAEEAARGCPILEIDGTVEIRHIAEMNRGTN